MKILAASIALLLGVTSAAHSVLDYGATASSLEIDTPTSFKNTDAFLQAVQAANSSESDRVVHIPALPQGQRMYMMPILFENIHNITIVVDAEVVASADNVNWPNHTDWHMERQRHYMEAQAIHNKPHLRGSDYGPVISFWEIHDSSDLHFTGRGTVDGQGYWWWMRDYAVLNYGNRPHLLRMDRVRNVEIDTIRWVNSPMYHMFLMDIDNFYIHDFEIFVDVYEQKKLAKQFGLFDYQLDIPTFPLNTDGIDPSGTNIMIRNVSITNFDDAVAVKPANGAYQVATCAQNITVVDCNVTYSVGMTIGSVPPSIDHACIRDVTFRNINFEMPIKAIYVKTNPGDVGTGIIENILYENIKMRMPIWWGIYIGPQQQKQPDGDGPGCMLYPVIKQCYTQPLVTVRNITLRNVVSTEGVLPPGIIRCNETNPCTDFTFENVYQTGWFTLLEYGYITENVFGTSFLSFPNPGFASNATDIQVKQRAFNSVDQGAKFTSALEFRNDYYRSQIVHDSRF